MKAKTKYRLIDTAGQFTAVITTLIQPGQLPKLANAIMRKNPRIEQVGYLQDNNFKMMGDELSINGLISGAFLLNQAGQINGLDFIVTPSTITLSFPKSVIKSIDSANNIVKLQGITYQIKSGFPFRKIISTKARFMLQKLATYSPASGIIYYKDKRIKPLVFVKATNSYVWENACGSGSLATALITKQPTITQPSGQQICFQFTGKNIVVTTTAKEV